MRAVLGIDPGGQHTGLALCQGDQLLEHGTVERGDMTMANYLTVVIQAVVWHSNKANDVLLAVEDLNQPNPHMGVMSVRGLIDTAQVLGAVLAWWPTTVLVGPGGHGSGPLATYPPELRPARGKGRGRDALRHERSAYDIAHAGRIQHRLARRAAAVTEGNQP